MKRQLSALIRRLLKRDIWDENGTHLVTLAYAFQYGYSPIKNDAETLSMLKLVHDMSDILSFGDSLTQYQKESLGL